MCNLLPSLVGFVMFVFAVLFLLGCFRHKKASPRVEGWLWDEKKGSKPAIQIAQVKSFPKEKRNEAINRLKGIEGVNHRQLARILGVSPNLVFKA